MPIRLALPLLCVAALLGWSAGGVHAERRAAVEWTYGSVEWTAKGDRR